MILMLGLIGLRTTTVIALDVAHIDTENGLVWITEKGRRQRQLVLPEMLNKLLEIYIAEEHRSDGPLFLSTRKKRISPRVLQDIFRSAADNLGIEKRLHAPFFVIQRLPTSTRLPGQLSPRPSLVTNGDTIP